MNILMSARPGLIRAASSLKYESTALDNVPRRRRRTTVSNMKNCVERIDKFSFTTGYVPPSTSSDTSRLKLVSLLVSADGIL